jgi:hypothetical protein
MESNGYENFDIDNFCSLAYLASIVVVFTIAGYSIIT